MGAHLVSGSKPVLTIQKNGKSFILTVEAEVQLEVPYDQLQNTCTNSETFDNNIVEGLHSISITAAKVKITPATKSSGRRFTSLSLNPMTVATPPNWELPIPRTAARSKPTLPASSPSPESGR
jgi:hypothetical protein